MGIGSGELCDTHRGAPFLNVGLDVVCSLCAEAAYQGEKANGPAIFQNAVRSLSDASLTRLNAWLEKKKFDGVYPHEALLRAVTAYTVSIGCSVDEVLAKVAGAKSADFLFANFNQ